MSKHFHQYQIVSQLARNGTSRVYLAQPEDTPTQQVLIKVFEPANLNDEAAQRRFAQEATALTQLKHPGVLPVLDQGIDNAHPYLVRSYLAQGTLASMLKRRLSSRLPLEQVLSLLTQIGHALAYVHQRRIVHGSVKPDNILLYTDDEVVLGDFLPPCLAKELATIERPTSHFALYMAPEQFAGQSGPLSDQYALGCVAYEMLTGRVPFSALAYSTLRQKHLSEPPTPLQKFVPDLPEYIEAAILKALAKNPAERHHDIAAFLSALQAGLDPHMIQELLVLSSSGESQERDWFAQAETSEMPLGGMLATATAQRSWDESRAEQETSAVAGQWTPAAAAQSPLDTAIGDTPALRKRPSKKMTVMAIVIACLVIMSAAAVPHLFAPAGTTIPDKKPHIATPLVYVTATTVQETPTAKATARPKVVPVGSTPTLKAVPTFTPTSAPTPTPSPTPVAPAIPIVNNAGFETPALGPDSYNAYTYAPSGAGWSFTARQHGSGTGITTNNSMLDFGGAPAPQGNQVAFIQGSTAFSQQITFRAGKYKVSFYAAQSGINSAQNSVQVLIDGNVVGSCTPGGNAYQTCTTNTFTVTSGAHTLLFQGQDNGGNNDIALVDNVAIAVA